MPYQTTIKERTRPVDVNDVISCDHIHVDRDALPRLLERWNGEHGLPFLPQDLETIFGSVFEQGLALTITDHGQENLEFTLGERGATYSYLTKQIYCPRLKKREGNEITLGKGLQGQKLGAKIFRMFLELDIALGFRETTFIASRANGGYVWARMGFSLDMEHKEAGTDIPLLSDRIMSRLEALESLVPVHVYQEAKKLAQLKNADDICRLAELDFDLRGRFVPEDCGVKTGKVRDRLRDTFDSKASINPFESLHFSRKASEAMCGVMEHAIEKNRPASLGKLLLTGETWNARADILNPIQVKKIGDYGGGMSASEFIPDASTRQVTNHLGY